MNQTALIYEFVKAVEELDELDYVELALLSVTESPAVADFIQRVFQAVRDKRPLPLEMRED